MYHGPYMEVKSQLSGFLCSFLPSQVSGTELKSVRFHSKGFYHLVVSPPHLAPPPQPPTNLETSLSLNLGIASFPDWPISPKHHPVSASPVPWLGIQAQFLKPFTY